MPKIDARLPKGMRDFLPEEVLKRQYVFGVITDVFKTFGFEPIETPVLEMEDTLLGKYGDEAEKLIFHAQHPGGKEELALRYDLTVPLSRYVSMHENDLSFPFRRYHIAPVWRAERPQKGRYREFYQCDADIVGIEDPSADAEIVSLVTTALRRLGFADFKVNVNHRQILTGIGIYAGVPDAQLGDLYRSVDKLDKIGIDGVAAELRASGIAEDVITRMFTLLERREGGAESLGWLRELLADIEPAQKGIADLEQMVEYLNVMGVPQENVQIDYAMVRGLSYYTGPIFETVITKPDNLGSVTGGGRYDELVGLFRKQSLPTTGTSLGVERIIDLMDKLDLYPPALTGTVVEALVTVFEPGLQGETLKLANELRAGGVRSEAFMQPKKSIGKQVQYADRKGVRVVAFLGSEEIKNGVVNFKRLGDGTEISAPRAEAVQAVRSLLSE
ncbi:MAG TPA: histidine--tRNA ligase [Aggregatilinea sp.]|uniref:histidine--tRNA ligase n=1 Tax=Aggregatilinea sp. TaxID=2806333 RepID=UPI002BE7241C|nr:histidine--tRNA ligase [Aggregatilinea sp.]HML24634.1 histidine--tRNA ligase [Aggregatilinea sp.]